MSFIVKQNHQFYHLKPLVNMFTIICEIVTGLIPGVIVQGGFSKQEETGKGGGGVREKRDEERHGCGKLKENCLHKTPVFKHLAPS